MIKIRDAAVADAAAIVQVHYDAVHTTAAADYDADVLASWSSTSAERVARLEEQIRTNPDRTRMIVAILDGQVAGFGEVVPHLNELRAVYVSPQAGRQGAGRAILNALEKIAREAGAEHLWLDSSLTAERFYADNGFKVIERGEHVLGTGLRMPCVKMSKKLI